ncbi:MAG: 50S ribosomal protein L11 methyltransferase [Sphingomonadales bacterium]|nr:50S ribosomal protein L11 methyltransferase [Sphingomonadales bacterium]
MNWLVTLPCTRAEAEALHEDDEWLALLEPMPTVVAEEVEAFNDLAWQVKAYFAEEPDQQLIVAIQARLPSAAGPLPIAEKLPDEDWLVMSQQSLVPVHAGRFYVHTSTNKGVVPDGATPFLIEASRAFGTGGHETTSGCLAMLDRMKRAGRRHDHIADIGTGTGLLAFAARHLRQRAYGTASDIDPGSVEGTMGNDLVIANILAGPLIELAPSFAAVTGDGGSLILAGLLDTQVDGVLRAYRSEGFRLHMRHDNGDWPCLWLIKRRRYRWQRPIRADGRTSQPPGDFGTW